MKTILIIGAVLLLIIYGVPKLLRLYLQDKTNDDLINLMRDLDIKQSLNQKYNKNVVRDKNGRFKSKNEADG